MKPPAVESSPAQPIDPAFARLRDGKRLTSASGLELRLASAFGFCQGVRLAVERATETARELAAAEQAADRDPQSPRLYMTGEIIHNPAINAELLANGVIVLPATLGNRFERVRACDCVIIPAFGLELAAEKELRAIGCRLIDTTCGWVRRVWRTVAAFAADGLTVVIHGKVDHEETHATASRVPGPWLVVRNRAEAEAMALLILARPDHERPARATQAASAQVFARTFSGKCSPGFDPQRDLARLGLVNQTTMLSSETHAIADILRAALRVKLQREPCDDEFRTLDTFCTATEERQEAVRTMLASGDVAAMLVVGGYRSSNTAHLASLAAQICPAYHIENAAGLISREEICHLPPSASAPAVTRDWFPPLPTVIAISAGASTPDRETADVVRRLLEITGVACPTFAGDGKPCE